MCNPKWSSTSLEAPSASRMCCECWDAFLLTTFIRRGYLSYRSFSLSFSQLCHSPLVSLINKVFLFFHRLPFFFFQTFLSKPCGLLKIQKNKKSEKRVTHFWSNINATVSHWDHVFASFILVPSDQSMGVFNRVLSPSVSNRLLLAHHQNRMTSCNALCTVWEHQHPWIILASGQNPVVVRF